MDGFGNGRTIFSGFLKQEDESTLNTFIQFFKDSNEPWDKIETIIFDKDFTELKVLRASFPNSRILYCLFHVIKAMKFQIAKLNITNDTKKQLLNVVRRMIYSSTSAAFEDSLDDIESLSTDFKNYLFMHWLDCKEMWAMHLRNCLTLGNNTNNRLESYNQKIKQVTNASNSLPVCIEKLLALNTAQEQKVIYNVYNNDCTIVSINGEDEIVTLLFKMYTDFAANLAKEQWTISKHKQYTVEESNAQITVSSPEKGKYYIEKDLCTCTCRFHLHYKIPCCHILYFLKKKHITPTIKLASERWHRKANRAICDGNVPKKSLLCLTTRNAEQPIPTTRQQKYLKAKKCVLEIASIISEFGQNEYNKKIKVLQQLRELVKENENIVVYAMTSDPMKTCTESGNETPSLEDNTEKSIAIKKVESKVKFTMSTVESETSSPEKLVEENEDIVITAMTNDPKRKKVQKMVTRLRRLKIIQKG